jgi:hypothetical protein
MTPGLRSTAAVFTPKVQSRTRIFLVAQKLAMIPTRELRSLLLVPKDATIPSGTTIPSGNYFTETVQRLRLAEQEASASHSAHPCSHSSRPASELSHCSISAEGFHHTGCARPEATTPHSPRARSCSPRCSRASPQQQIRQENHLHIYRNTSDAHEQVRRTLDTDTLYKG